MDHPPLSDLLKEGPKGPPSDPAFLSGGGEMGERMRAFDWSETALGAIENWSPALRMMTSFLLSNRFPLLLWWGPQYVSIYNDAYIPVLGTKHPWALGQSVSECWKEIWHILQPLIDTPFNGGPATWNDDITLEINRHGFVEETHFTIAYSPVPDETVPSGIGGVLATVHEITQKVIGERRIALLRDLGARLAEGRTAEDVCRIAAKIIGQHPKDIPFALFYLIDKDEKHARLVGSCGAIGKEESPSIITLEKDSAESIWPLAAVLREETPQLVGDLSARLSVIPPGPWSDPPQNAIVVPVASCMAHPYTGMLVLGVSARLRFDNVYRGFVELLAAQVAMAIVNARAYEEERKRAEALAELDHAKTGTAHLPEDRIGTPGRHTSPARKVSPFVEEALRWLPSEDRTEDSGLRTEVIETALPLLGPQHSVLSTEVARPRVLVADDNADMREYVLRLLSSQGYEVEAVTDGQAALDRAQANPPDLVLTDVMMPRLDGFGLLHALRNNPATKTIPVILLSARAGEESRVEGLEHGADDYLIKPFSARELLARVETHLRIAGMRRDAEAALRESEARSREMIDALPAAIYTTDAHGRLTHFNPAAVEFSGRVPELGTDEWCVSWKLYYPDGTPMPHDQCPMAIALKEGRTVRGAEAIAERPDGTRVWFMPYPTPLRDADGNIAGGINMLVDITERKRAEEAKVRLSAIVESSDDAIISKDLQGIITSWNKGAEKVFGYTADEAIGKPITMLFPPDCTDEEPRILKRIARGETLEHYETVRRRKDGTDIHISLTVSPIRDEAGTIKGASKIARDITGRKRVEEALRRLNDQLEQRVAERTYELAQSEDHLRTLATELNLVEQRERKRLATELHDHLQQMLVLGRLTIGQGKRVAAGVPAYEQVLKKVDDIFSDALTYSRTLVSDLSPTVLRDHGLAAALQWLGTYMQKHNQTVIVTVPDDGDLKLPEDQVILLFQSVRELLINSSKHAGTGEATLRMEQHDGLLRIEVRDEGAGFDLAAAVAGTPSGGISSKFGLLSIRERMRALGGSFSIQSAPGEGTTATLTLPLRSSAEVRDATNKERHVNGRRRDGEAAVLLPATQSSALQQPAKIRVLLVDDHPTMRQGLRSIVTAYDHLEVVGEASNGAEAVELAQGLDPDVVVMDINMPKMDGIEATHQIKANQPTTVIIGLSVNQSADTEKKMKAAGVSTYLTKESAVDVLCHAIEQAVSYK